MTYKGYRILANAQRTVFFETNADGERGEVVQNIQYQTFDGDNDIWYSLIDKDNWVEQSFETVTECKEYIDWALKEGILAKVK